MRVTDQLIRLLVLGPPARPKLPAPAAPVPGEDASLGHQRVMPAYVLAVVVPLGFGALLIAVRGELHQAISLLMMLPVLVVAALGGIGPAITAAVMASVTFDVFHTTPYYRFTIDNGDDIVEMVVLLTVGTAAGAFTHAMRRAVVASEARRIEIEQLTGFVDATMRIRDPEELMAHATGALTSLLSLQSCEWHPGYHGTASAVLQPDGRLSTTAAGVRLPEAAGDASRLPVIFELPVKAGTEEVGRFVLRGSHAPVSIEERRAAGTIARLLARSLPR